jgi:hypothetical protein
VQNVLVVLQPDFVIKVNLFLEFLYEHLDGRGEHIPANKEEFKQRIWQLLKGQWAHSPEIFDPELFDNLPDELKHPLLSIVKKEQRGTFKLDNGYEVPMLNYGGKLTPISRIPNVLCHIGSCQTVAYNEKGETAPKSSAAQGIIGAMKNYPKN